MSIKISLSSQDVRRLGSSQTSRMELESFGRLLGKCCSEGVFHHSTTFGLNNCIQNTGKGFTVIRFCCVQGCRNSGLNKHLFEDWAEALGMQARLPPSGVNVFDTRPVVKGHPYNSFHNINWTLQMERQRLVGDNYNLLNLSCIKSFCLRRCQSLQRHQLTTVLPAVKLQLCLVDVSTQSNVEG